MCWNGLEAAGGAAMGDMLALNMGLKHLDLSHCRLGPEACLLLGEGIKVCGRCDALWGGWGLGFSFLCTPQLDRSAPLLP